MMEIESIQTRVFREGEDLPSFIYEHLPHLPSESILVVTSKIVALSEGRTAPMGGEAEKKALIESESERAIRTSYKDKHLWLTIKSGMVMANAGIDASNAKGKLILLPQNSFASADFLRTTLRARYNAHPIGILVTDSRTAPLRAGVVGAALGYAGFKGLREYRGTPDLFGRPLEFTRTNIADSLAASAVVLMGEGSERQPLALIRGAPVEWQETVSREELTIPLEDDLYGPLFKS